MRRALDESSLLIVVLESKGEAPTNALSRLWESHLRGTLGEPCGFFSGAGATALVSRWDSGKEGLDGWRRFVETEGWRAESAKLSGQPSVLLLREDGQIWPEDYGEGGGLLCVTRDATVAVREDRRKRGPKPGLKLATREELPAMPEGIWAWAVLGHQGRLLVALRSVEREEQALRALEVGGWCPLVEAPRRWGAWTDQGIGSTEAVICGAEALPESSEDTKVSS